VTGSVPFVIAPRREWALAVDFDLRTRKQTGLLGNVDTISNEHDTMNVVYGTPQIRTIGGHPFAFVKGEIFVQHRGQVGLFKVDLDHGDAATVFSEGLEDTEDYVVDAKGALRAESEYNAPASRWALKLWKGHWSEVRHEAAAIEPPTLEGIGRDGASIAVTFSNDKNENVVKEFSTVTGAWSDPVPSPGGLLWDPAAHNLIGQSALIGDDLRYTFFAANDQATWAAVLRAYKGNLVGFSGMSDDHRKFLLRVDSPTEGPAYALVDMDTKRGDWIGDEYPALKPEDIGPKQAIAFKAADGLELTGYLTLPHGSSGTGLPLVVFPHGGPAVRDGPGFDWWAQAMASRGYAVLQVNYRGSWGFGWDHMAAGFGQWGRKMQTDLSDGVRYLAGRGIIDPHRVCIVGASYGGYAALAGATLDPGVYRCAVSVAGPSDLRRMVSDDKNDEGDQGVGIERYWLRYMGPRNTLDDISPAKLADKVTIPILLIHGKDDTVVPYLQSQIMADALRKAGKPVEFVTLSKEDHWLSHRDTRLEMLRAATAFVEKNNPPD
jgi:dienelactone hydrolase